MPTTSSSSAAAVVVGAAVLVVALSGCASPAAPRGEGDLATPAKRDIAMQLVSSAENSTLDWRAQYGYLEDIGDGRGYTGGLIGFTSGTADMLLLVQNYTTAEPDNPLAPFLPALHAVDGSASHAGLGESFERAWGAAAGDPVFRRAQDALLDSMYFDPAVSRARKDGLGALGQFIYYDAIVMHGPGSDGSSFGGIRSAALAKAKTPAEGGDETRYLNAFLDVRVRVMREEAAHDDVSRVSTEQRVFVREGNLDLHTPLRWKVYGDPYRIG
jgi:chitosanase